MELLERSKWRKHGPTFKVGDLVFLVDGGISPLHWSMGRVTETFPGTDGVSLVPKLRTNDDILLRPVVKLLKLPV